MIIFKKARSPKQTLNDLDSYLQSVGTEPIKLLARQVQSWGEISYDELADLIADGRLDDYLDWQGRYSALIAGTLAPLWSDAITAASRKATAGKVVLYDSNDYVRAWLETHGGELITQLSRESQKAVAMVILLGQSNRMASRDIAKQVRPLIGLNERQAAANLNYREKVYNKYREQGMDEVKARERADKAAIKYAGKQHRFRAETIVHTELAFAYNRGAHMGVSQGIADGLMGRCAMKWSTAGTNRVCSRCLALKDTIVGYTDESGVTLPPLHPRCRCAIIYDEVAAPRRVDNKPKPQISMSTADIPKWPPRDKSKIIPKEDYVKLRELAEEKGITLIGVKNFDGSVAVVREIITTLSTLKEPFPEVSNKRHKLELEMSTLMHPQDYAETTKRKIKLNAVAYRDIELLEMEYQKDVADGWFVQGTDYRAIIHHEFGHVVANVYKLDPLKIACEITRLKPKEILPYVNRILSKYAGSFADGREIISEVFADMSTGNPSDFSSKFYKKVLELTRE